MALVAPTCLRRRVCRTLHRAQFLLRGGIFFTEVIHAVTKRDGQVMGQMRNPEASLATVERQVIWARTSERSLMRTLLGAWRVSERQLPLVDGRAPRTRPDGTLALKLIPVLGWSAA